MTMHRYGSHVMNRIVALLKRVDDRIALQIYDILDGLTVKEIEALKAGNYTTKRLISLRDSLKELQNEVTSVTTSVLGDEGKKLAAYELERTRDIAIAMGAEALGSSVSVNQVYAAAMSRPMLGRHIRDHVRDLSLFHRKEIMAAITEGYVLGESTTRIMTRIRGTAEAKRSDGLFYKRNGALERLVVRNSISHISGVASMESYKELGLKEYYLSPVFDGRTSPICRAWNSGGIQYFEVGKGPLPPFHPGGCRTIPLPRVKGDRTAPKPFVNDTRPVKDIPKDERDDKIGVTNAKTFEAHLKRQSAALQKEWLGPTRYKLWKAGMPLGKFADPRKGIVYNLDQLRAKNAEIFQAAGI